MRGKLTFVPVRNCLQNVVIDSDRVELLQESWYLHSRGYVINRNGELLHHRVIGRPPSGMVTDHIDGNKLNNQSDNLRFCTPGENQKNRCINKNNTSGYPGVNLVYGSRWYASIWHNRKKIHLGTYDTFADALAARKLGEEKYGARVRT